MEENENIRFYDLAVQFMLIIAQLVAPAQKQNSSVN